MGLMHVRSLEVELPHEPSLGWAHAIHSARFTGGDGGGSATCEERRPYHRRFMPAIRDQGIIETPRHGELGINNDKGA
jgi:hypothetical protein